MELAPNASLRGVKPVAWFDSKTAAALRLGVGPALSRRRHRRRRSALGKGKVFLFGPEITFRAQPHGTFKFLFNCDLLRHVGADGGWSGDEHIGASVTSQVLRARDLRT